MLHHRSDVLRCVCNLWRGLLLALLIICAGCTRTPAMDSYPAKDFDPILTEYARNAKPIIAAIDAYQKAKGSLPSEANVTLEIAPYLPTGGLPPNVHLLRADEYQPSSYGQTDKYWSYHKQAGGFSLDHRIGHETWLIYESDGQRAPWVFVRWENDPAGRVRINLSP